MTSNWRLFFSSENPEKNLVEQSREPINSTLMCSQFKPVWESNPDHIGERCSHHRAILATWNSGRNSFFAQMSIFLPMMLLILKKHCRLILHHRDEIISRLKGVFFQAGFCIAQIYDSGTPLVPKACARGAPSVRKYGNPAMREILVL